MFAVKSHRSAGRRRGRQACSSIAALLIVLYLASVLTGCSSEQDDDSTFTVGNTSLTRHTLVVGPQHTLAGYEDKHPTQIQIKNVDSSRGRDSARIVVTFDDGREFEFTLYQRIGTKVLLVGNSVVITLEQIDRSTNPAHVELGIEFGNPDQGVTEQDRSRFEASRRHGTDHWSLPMNAPGGTPPISVSGDVANRTAGTASVGAGAAALSLTLNTVEVYPGDTFRISRIGTFTVNSYTIGPEAPDPNAVGGSPGTIDISLRWQY
ncbi:hypothetical protein [Gordonia oryzae]|uniref:hypothetical protein n=1 Tax=Gordonia oryzae TaxID=2487349 RepID=UPI000F4E06D1|nr:hypothetical protein [Gordonia oryzae]